jgi:uncharacterized SAM-binding protein YcdF (DUF218 family)
MSFVISKIAWALLTPGVLLLFALVYVWLRQLGKPGAGRRVLGLVVLFLAVMALCPVAHWCLSPLEQRFPRPPDDLAKVDGIVVLGGAIDADRAPGSDRPTLNGSAERVTSFVALARRYPEARLVYSGGSGEVRRPQKREADYARTLLESLGMDTERVVFERDSRNTWENAVDSKALAHPQPGETWLLVTSAWHMPRAVGCFRKVGWDVTPYPVNYVGNDASDWAKFQPELELGALAMTEREWIGMIVYRMMGRSDSLFPGPAQARPQ